ncbi:MAG: hypothetical protein D6773_12910 [Alphaproteobacteria bacterium]|nr:MAG: hypothetical protein D6773_12910 [Alphaproteobacteria bacterium]
MNAVTLSTVAWWASWALAGAGLALVNLSLLRRNVDALISRSGTLRTLAFFMLRLSLAAALLLLAARQGGGELLITAAAFAATRTAILGHIVRKEA